MVILDQRAIPNVNPPPTSRPPGQVPVSAFEEAMAAVNPDVSSKRPELRNAAVLARQGQIGEAAGALQQFLKNRPQDADALFLLGDIARQEGRFADAERLFARSVDIAPAFDAARFHQANTLLEIGQAPEALAHSEVLLARDPKNPVFHALKAMALELLDEHPAAALLWQQVVEEGAPEEYRIRQAHVLRVLGRREDSIAACREAIGRDPSFGRAWWTLAMLAGFGFSDEDVAQMEALAAQPELPIDRRVPLLFALGKAYAQRQQYAKSFGYYARGNGLKRLGIRHDPGVLSAFVARSKTVFTQKFFAAREGYGCESREPIFLVGMLRAGSTLVEQILASHSQIEGTREMYNLGAIGAQLQRAQGAGAYPAILESLDDATRKQLGQRYLEAARVHRKLGRPQFIDKMGNNFVHLGLLHLILPNAKIIDVRRNPLACCFSNFTQLYANGQDETYRLADLGQLYRDYVDLMAHFDSVLPGRVHRVLYEELVADPDGEIRRLLDYLELPFEEACLHFHRNTRAVSTISSEQVRSPLYTEALDYWRHYEPWLGPLQSALGAAVRDWEGR
jgi:tetratricopeptide (TPR) repeat protein